MAELSRSIVDDMDDTSKDFKIVQVWPSQLVRTRKYEKAMSERSDAINR